ncbi:MAG TPA: patatin-like phospholipase family protein [Gaiellaceae bacterium]|nr:patatin-like phospholipase family protein [Gaiellaceae bacterium]
MERKVAFVLGGGGHAGAAEVGMLHALLERDVRPELVVGTSVGALHGAMVAADPTIDSVKKLEAAWKELAGLGVLGRSWFTDAAGLLRARTHVRSNLPMRRLAERLLPVESFEELIVPFQCVAACIERFSEHWFASGPLVDAILASAAVPGILPPVEIGGEHFIDGGIVNSIPVDRAVALGAGEIYVLHAGRVEQPLTKPRNMRDVGFVAFEIARRHRFVRDLAAVPEGVRVHVLPTGDPAPPRFNDLSQLRFRDFRRVDSRIRFAYAATSEYLDRRS